MDDARIKCEKCGKLIKVAYGILAENKKKVLNLCWDCYQQIINQNKKDGKKKKSQS